MPRTKEIRKIVVYAMLYVYLFAQVKPLIPLAKDFLAHTFFKTEHLATVHFENGKYHLHVELKKEGSEQNNAHKNSTAAGETVSVHEQGNELKLILFSARNLRDPDLVLQSPADVSLKTFIPPPEV